STAAACLVALPRCYAVPSRLAHWPWWTSGSSSAAPRRPGTLARGRNALLLRPLEAPVDDPPERLRAHDARSPPPLQPGPRPGRVERGRWLGRDRLVRGLARGHERLDRGAHALQHVAVALEVRASAHRAVAGDELRARVRHGQDLVGGRNHPFERSPGREVDE